jgi:hypothetical protein
MNNYPESSIFRHELKYFINYHEYLSLRNKLNILLSRDSHSLIDGNYHIRSLYFDDIYNSSLFEKQSGILNRKKYRIRIYNLSSDIIKLEKKSKIGQFINKKSITLTKNQVKKIMNFDYEFLLGINNSLANEFYFDLKNKVYRPKVIVDYIREAFMMNINRIRITFDKFLKNGLYDIDIFRKDMPLISSIDENYYILEVKFSNFLPDYLKSILQITASSNQAISKYVFSRKMTKTMTWEDQ